MALDPETLAQRIGAVRRFVEERLIPLEAQVSEDDRIPDDVVDEMRELGLFGLTIPEAYGGLGLNTEEECQLVLELGRTSPVVDGQSIKGPTSKLMSELEIGSSSKHIAAFYRDFIAGFVLDHQDTNVVAAIAESGIQTCCSDIVMSTLADRRRLARDVVDFAASLTRK